MHFSSGVDRRTLTVKDACDYASIGQSKLFEFIKSGKVQALRLSGRHTLILRDSTSS
jgi:excisionase family DNA binding protein